MYWCPSLSSIFQLYFARLSSNPLTHPGPVKSGGFSCNAVILSHTYYNFFVPGYHPTLSPILGLLRFELSPVMLSLKFFLICSGAFRYQAVTQPSHPAEAVRSGAFSCNAVILSHLFQSFSVPGCHPTLSPFWGLLRAELSHEIPIHNL